MLLLLLLLLLRLAAVRCELRQLLSQSSRRDGGRRVPARDRQVGLLYDAAARPLRLEQRREPLLHRLERRQLSGAQPPALCALVRRAAAAAAAAALAAAAAGRRAALGRRHEPGAERAVQVGGLERNAADGARQLEEAGVVAGRQRCLCQRRRRRGAGARLEVPLLLRVRPLLPRPPVLEAGPVVVLGGGVG
jgi:hypothetical protein